MDDRTIGLVLRALRRRRGWRQSDLADRAGCSQSLVSSVERGHLDGVAIETIRRLFAAVDARVVLEARWRGAELERLLDADHAAIGRALATRIEAVPGWQVLAEVTYSVGTERGSIDLLAVCPGRRAVLVIEIKSDIPSAEATGRKLDEKRRLAPMIVRERLGWSPVAVGAVLSCRARRGSAVCSRGQPRCSLGCFRSRRGARCHGFGTPSPHSRRPGSSRISLPEVLRASEHPGRVAGLGRRETAREIRARWSGRMMAWGRS